ncbi:hypothetical protein AAVH_19231 [Aphelenchoides avenae]|nr:hypothetical protein AAVH_19231 [Aphelenchus avenae]
MFYRLPSRAPCAYPAKSCCGSYVAQVISGKIVCTGPPANPVDSCVSTATPTTPPPSCCGTWSAWTVTVGCAAGACGACEKRTKTRTCLTGTTCPCKPYKRNGAVQYQTVCVSEGLVLQWLQGEVGWQLDPAATEHGNLHTHRRYFTAPGTHNHYSMLRDVVDVDGYKCLSSG